MDIAFLCGGEGTRLRPLTYEVPKPMLPIGSKPILEINIERAKKQNFARAILIVNYKADVIEGYFGDGTTFGIDILYEKENEPRGTAGALASLIDLVKTPLVVMNADILCDIPLQDLVKFHKEKSSQVTIALKRVQMNIPYGVAQIDDQKSVTRLEEKPQKDFLISSGIYVVSRDAMELIPTEGKYHMTDLINDAMQKQMVVTGFEFDEKWRDIGRLDDYIHAANSEPGKVNGSNIEDIEFSFRQG